jgi:ACS family hexuronate transporter-like MFS transporter
MTNPTEQEASPSVRPGAGPAVLQDVLPLEYQAALGTRTRRRWIILALVFFAITINYIDRMVLGILAPDLRAKFRIDDQAYGYITSAFGLSYALGQMASGRWLDWVGTRVGYAIALVCWSIASMLHAAVGSAWGFGFARALLGVTESPAYPAATKTLAEWFPKKERALAMGFVNAGSNIGAIAAPMLVPWLALNFGWQWAFIVSGGIGLIWIAFWIPMYRRPHEHPGVNAAELAHINSDPREPTGKIRWRTLLGYRQTWGFALGKFMTDPIWSFYLFWFPSFLKDKHKVGLTGVAAPLIVAYVMADVGSIAGGWLSSHLIHRGWSVNRARKTAFLLSTLCILPAAFTSVVESMWTATFIVGLALAGHQGFSSNLYTLVSDTFPKRAVGSVAGLGGTFGYVGYTLFGVLIGWILTVTNKNYLPIFIIAASAYVVALTAIHLLMPRLAPADIGDDERGFPVLPPQPPI